MDWFGVRASSNDPKNKCVFCQDKRINIFDESGDRYKQYKTTSCRHRVCTNCEADALSGRRVCPLCKSNIGQLRSKHPQYLALDLLSQIRKQVFDVYNLDLDRDFAGDLAKYNLFVEGREEMVCLLQQAELSSGEEKKQLSLKAEREKQAFVLAHKQAIDRNSSRIEDRRRVTMNEIKVMSEELKRNKDAMRREKEMDEELRNQQLAKSNNAKLGFHVSSLSGLTSMGGGGMGAPAVASTPAVVDESRQIVPNIDILMSIQRPLPSLAKRAKLSGALVSSTPAVLVNGALLSSYKAGGKRDLDPRTRTLEEMRAGWALLAFSTKV
ncbi:hypothetical protein BASA81_002689 [Batrachochytrium salamandrivorans]|nr:hypothetical protein BASA81_002689 [Batrachochytrium salamandrivorans]